MIDKFFSSKSLISAIIEKFDLREQTLQLSIATEMYFQGWVTVLRITVLRLRYGLQTKTVITVCKEKQ